MAEGGLHAVAAFFSHADTTLDLTHEKLNELFAHTFTTHEESTEVSSAVSRAYAEVIVKFDPKKHNPNLGRLF